MFNKKILLMISLFLIVILQISFVSAQNDNQTEIIDESSEYCKTDNNLSSDFQNNIENDDCDVIERYQGDIPIRIDSPSSGVLTIFIDGREYDLWPFDEKDIIHISTYNFKSFDDDSYRNIDVGQHNLSLIFDFDMVGCDDAEIFLDENSVLNFKFSNPITDNYRYTYNATLNILKKDRTIHISEFTFYNLLKPAQCVIRIDNLERYYDEEYFFPGLMGVIVKKDKEVFKWMYYELENPFIIDFVLDEEGVYNFTVINFIDGTMDWVMFKAEKYRPEFNVSYIIDKNTIKINLANLTDCYNDWAKIIVDNISKELPLYEYKQNNWTVTFENLSSGVHSLNIEFCGDSWIEDVYYNATFVIEEGSDFDKGDVSLNNSDYTNSSVSEENYTSGLIKSNGTSGGLPHSGEVIKNHRAGNSHSVKNTVNSQESVMNSLIGDAGSDSSSSLKKSHEIVKKSIFNLNNDLIPFLFIVIVIILLITGYFRSGDVKK